jgi:hypothetical protein
MGVDLRNKARRFNYLLTALAAVLVLTGIFAGCGATGSSLIDKLPENEKYKRIIIYDTDSAYQVQIHELREDERIILALWDAATEPVLTDISGEELMTLPFAISKIQNNTLDVRLSEQLDWWDGTGNYWVLFVVTDAPGTKVTVGYLSKEPRCIDKKTTYLFNKDFMLPAILDIDLTGVLPF